MAFAIRQHCQAFSSVFVPVCPVDHGVSLPEDSRITTRTCEEPDSPKFEPVENLPHLTYDGDRVVFICDGLVTVVEVIHDHD